MYMDIIMRRKSYRKYTGEQIPKDKIDRILLAAMQSPTSGNQRANEFIVIRDKETFKKILELNPNAPCLKYTDTAILVCENLSLMDRYTDFFVEDASAAAMTILYEAEYLDLGGVWVGIHPREEVMKGVSALLGLPDHVVPVNLISLGCRDKMKEPNNFYDETKVHYEKW